MSMGKRPPKNGRRVEVSTRLPHPDEYYTDSGLSWTFQIAEVTPAIERVAVGLEIWALAIKRNITIPAVMLSCVHGVLGFTPEAETAEMRHALDVVGRAFVSLGSGFRATGVARLRGQVIAVEGEAVTVEVNVLLRQRRGEPEATISPEIRRAIYIKMVEESTS
jgi:hypothetical protein